jgi:hypothetical protein
MRTLLFWLLPIYNLVAAVLLVRSLRSSSDDGAPVAPAPPAALAIAWVLLGATVLNIALVRDPRLIAAPYILFAANALLSWWSGKRSQARAARA